MKRYYVLDTKAIMKQTFTFCDPTGCDGAWVTFAQDGIEVKVWRQYVVTVAKDKITWDELVKAQVLK